MELFSQVNSVASRANLSPALGGGELLWTGIVGRGYAFTDDVAHGVLYLHVTVREAGQKATLIVDRTPTNTMV